MPISLYECSNAHVTVDGKNLKCKKGYPFSAWASGELSILPLKRGTKLEYKICQGCPDFDRNGDPIPAEERGWLVES